jgi:hypothetical protein
VVGQKSIGEAGMRYLKSILVGVAAFVFSFILVNVLTLYVMTRLHPPQMPASTPAPVPASNNSAPVFDVTATWVDYPVPEWPSLIAGVASFALGFYWTFRRSTAEGNN